MKNYYSILEIKSTATFDEIKKAFKKAIYKAHPDRGGKKEDAQLINEAHANLIDKDKRRLYDAAWEIYNQDYKNKKPEDIFTDKMPTELMKFYGKSFSDHYRLQHCQLVERFEFEKSKSGDHKSFLKVDLNAEALSKLLANLKKLPLGENKALDIFNKMPLNPESIIFFLQNLLDGQFPIKALFTVKDKLKQYVAIAKPDPIQNYHIKLYEGALEIVEVVCGGHAYDDTILKSLEKIADYAKELAKNGSPACGLILAKLTPIFANKTYRQLFAFGMNKYLLSLDDQLDQKLHEFNGVGTIENLLSVFKEKVDIDHDPKHHKIIGLLGMLLRQSKHTMQIPDSNTKNISQFYREKAYLLLDWVPGISGFINQYIVLNTLFLAGINFQFAAKYEDNQLSKMADEKMAFRLYMTVFSMAQKSTPDERLYFATHALKYMLHFQFIDKDLEQVIPQLQHYVLHLADIFPFYESKKSNGKIFEDEGNSIVLLRAYLHNLIQNHDQNKNVYDLAYVRVLYEVYEACLNSWYDEKADPEVGDTFRQKLMQELLSINHWTFADVNNLLKPRGVTVTRDADEWLNPTRALSGLNGKDVYSSISSFEINVDTSQIVLGAKPWVNKQGRNNYERLFCDNDIAEIFQNNLSSAVFSLDPADPDMMYHPFNKVRFAPSALYQSQLLHTVLAVDKFFLKYLTIGKEVQAKEPYLMRNIDKMIQILPQYLRKIITDFHQNSQSGQIHRFWVEAEEIDVAVVEDDKHSTIKYIFGDMKMRVRKHAMMRNTGGDIIDKENDEEGWDFYVIKEKDKEKLNDYLEKTDRPALIWLEDNSSTYLYEDGNFSLPFNLQEKQELIKLLFGIKRNDHGKVIIENAKSQKLLYDITNNFCTKTGKKSHYSAEYIFAQEFTIHYDKFAVYFPELARLRELSKIVAMTRYLVGHCDNNQKQLAKLSNDLRSKKYWFGVRTQSTREETDSVKKMIASINKEHNFKEINEDVKSGINDLKQQIGIVPQNQHAAVLQQLRELLRQQYTIDNNTLTNAITRFLNGNDSDLVSELARVHKSKLAKEITEKVFKDSNFKDVYQTMEGDQHAQEILIKDIVDKRISILKQGMHKKIEKLENLNLVFKNMGITGKPAEINLDKKCLWVPASINHQVDDHSNRVVYGGVQIAPQSNVQRGNCAANAQANAAGVGTTVYRVYDNKNAFAYGQSWTTQNPLTNSHARDGLGLPNKNQATNLNVGTISSMNGVYQRRALAHDGNRGGWHEVVIPNASVQVQVHTVFKVKIPK